MYVCQLEINNFRGIRSARLPLKAHSVLIGPNNVGKSAVIDALSLLLGRDRLVRTLGDYDFFGGRPGPTSRIRLRATISGFSSNDPRQHPQWFNDRAASSPVWWDDSKQTVEHGEGAGRTLAMQIGFAARFDEDDLEVETLRYFVDGEGDAFEEPNLVKVKAAHLTELGFFLLPANRSWNRVVSFGSELFRRVLRFQDAIPGQAVTKLRDWLRSPEQRIENESPLREIVGRVNSELAAFVGADGAGLTFRPTTGDIEGVLAALTPHLLGRGEDVALPVERHGSGVISLQTLLLLLEFGAARRDKEDNFLLAAEEPELHLHPGHHRHLVARMRSVSSQTIATTHSPEIAAYYRPDEILLLNVSGDGDLTSRPLAAKMPSENALMRLVTIYRSELCTALMHRVVVVPEGFTEFRWFNGLLRACSGTAEGDESDGSIADGTPLAFGVVPTQDAKVVRSFDMLKGSAPCVVPLVDGDGAGDNYVKELLAAGCPSVLQLPAGMALEGLVASFICVEPLDESGWLGLEEALGEPLSVRSEVGLAQHLVTNKQRWNMHEALMSWIAERPAPRVKARQFLASLSQLPASEATWPADTQVPALRRWTPGGAKPKANGS